MDAMMMPIADHDGLKELHEFSRLNSEYKASEHGVIEGRSL